MIVKKIETHSKIRKLFLSKIIFQNKFLNNNKTIKRTNGQTSD